MTGIPSVTLQQTAWNRAETPLYQAANCPLINSAGLGLQPQQDHGLSRFVDLGSNPQRQTACHWAGCCVVSSTQPPPATFNYARDMLDWTSKFDCTILPWNSQRIFFPD